MSALAVRQGRVDIELKYDFKDGVFVDAQGRQLNEELVPNVEGQRVLFSFRVTWDEYQASTRAAREIVAWLRRDRGAVAIDQYSEIHETL